MCGALCLCVYLYNLWDIFNIVYYRKRKSLQEKKKILLKQGIKYYLQNDLYAARKELKKTLKLDKDDIDIIYYLSRIEKTLGEAGVDGERHKWRHGASAPEKQLLNKLSLLDFDNKWV